MLYRLGRLFRGISYGSEVVLLDLKSNRYKILNEQASDALLLCLSSPLDEFDLKKKEGFKIWVQHFLEDGIIEPSEDSSPFLVGKPLKSGGLKDYTWVLQKSSLPFSETSTLDTLECFFSLFSMNRLIRREGFKGIISFLRKKRQKKITWTVPSEKSLHALKASLDLACRYYPTEVVCLLWAVTFVYMALERGWDINLAVGGQLYPFFAHAWVEKEGKVFGDKEDLNLYLGIFLREPNLDDIPSPQKTGPAT